MLPRKNRLTTAQFERAFADSQVVRHPLVHLKAHFRGADGGEMRAAFVVPKKIGKAHDRNRARRRLRERFRAIWRENEVLNGCDLIFLATAQTGAASMEELDGALREVLRRMNRKIGADFPAERDKNRQNATRIGEPGLAPSFKRTDSIHRPLENVTGESAHLENLEEGVNSASPICDASISAENQVPTLDFADPELKEPALMARLALGAIGYYQRFISPSLPPSCRFVPSCSVYTCQAIERFGAARGLLLGAHRICRCQPFARGGIDLVPQQFPRWRPLRFLQRLRPLDGMRGPKS